MNTKHTPEPWHASGSVIYSDSATVVGDGYPLTLACAARIVACVNACAGMDDPAAEITALRAQGDKLLAALRSIASHTVLWTASTCVDVARRAIAKAEGRS